jgi:hypothetical protein
MCIIYCPQTTKLQLVETEKCEECEKKKDQEQKIRFADISTKNIFMGKVSSIWSPKHDKADESEFPKTSSLSPKRSTEDEMMIELSNLKTLHFSIQSIEQFITCYGRVPVLQKLLGDLDDELEKNFEQVKLSY